MGEQGTQFLRHLKYGKYLAINEKFPGGRNVEPNKRVAWLMRKDYLRVYYLLGLHQW